MSDVNSDPGFDNYDVRVTSSRNETSTQGFTIRNSRHVGKPGSWSENTDTFVKLEVRGTAIPPGPDVTLHLSDNEPLEDTERVTVTATVSPATPEAFTVEISASPVAPATGDDFELSTNRTLSFAANATGSTGTVRISPVSDDDPEPNDVVTVSGVVSNPAIPNPDDVRLTILNDDADLPQDIAIDAPEAVDEGAGTVNVTVTLTTGQNSAPVIDAQLFYRPRSETAMSGDDYIRPQGLGNRIAIVPVSAFSANADGTAWVARHSFEIGIVDDGVAEPEETIRFAIYTNSNSSGTKQTIRIRDNDTPVMRNVRVVNGPGAAGMWSAGEQVELEVRYTLPVAVEQPSSDDECWSYNADGTCKPPGPYVAVVFRSDARPGYGEVLGVAPARYVSGSGTATLRFAYTVGTAEAGARGVEVVDGKVLLRGATIRPLGGGDDVGPEFTRTRVMRVDVQKPGGGAWTAGDKVRVTVKFTGPGQRNLDTVKVDKTGGTPTIGLRLGDPQNRLLARTASYEGGSGKNTLEFEYQVTAGDGRISAVEVVPNSLARNGATIRNKQDYDAELDHLGVVWSSSLALRVRDTAAPEGGTLRFTMELAQASKAPVTVDYETADGTATAGEDYTAKRGTVTFAPGHTRKTVAVPVLRDEAAEDAETVVLRLSNVRAEGSEEPVEVTDPEAEGTIEDGASEGLTASFEGLPEAHDGESAFRFRVAFSEPIAISFRSLREDAFETTGGRVTRGTRVDGRKDLFEITVEPDGDGEVVVSLPAGRDCEVSGAICTWGPPRKQLTNTPTATVTGPAEETGPAPLTASFEGVPAAHDGESAFTLRIASSDRLSMMNGRRLREDVVAVSGGRATSAGRVDRRRDLWKLTVEPDSLADVTVTLAAGAACGTPAAVCTKDGRALSNTISATVRGPVGIAVADAHVEEDAGAVLAFAVTLSRAASRALTVDYATSDGSAQAGVDYTAASGTLTFQAGESSRTIEVGVLDDAHDEGEETLTLRLSNASGGLLTDGEATGTIENRDPLPRALLARFGRTAAVHVVEHVEERLEAPREPGFRGRFAGRELRRGMERDIALNFLRQLGGAAGVYPAGMAGYTAMAGSPAAGAAPLGTPGRGGGGALMMGAGGPMSGAAGFGGAAPLGAGPAGGPSGPDGGLNGGRFLRMGLGGGDLLTGSNFAMNRESHGGILSIWSRGAQSRFSGREGDLSLGGDVRTTMFGADYARGPLVAGLSLSNSRGLGEYAGAAGGQVASSVTGLYPWLGYKMTERVTVWGVAGYGTGGLLLTPDGGQALESGLSMAMASAGTRGDLLAGGAGGFALAFKADALWVGTSIDGVDGPAGRLKATEAAVTRIRTGLEGSRAYMLAGRLSLTPSVEVGLRHDGGDAETGAGMDVGAGLVMSDSSTGLAVDVRVRTLLVHQAEGFSERGVAVSLSYNPTPSSPLGFVARVAPSWGGQATSGAEALWGRETMAGMAPGGVASGNRLDGEVGYGLPVGSRLVGTPRVGFSTSEHARDYRVGYGLGLLNRESLSFELGIDAQRRESPLLAGASNGAVGRATVRW